MILLAVSSFAGPPVTDRSKPPERKRPRWENLDCQRTSVDQARARRPGRLAEEKPRGDWVARDVLFCVEHILAPGLRSPQDDAVLRTLEASAAELAAAAWSARPDLRERTWLVETFYPDAQVSAKLDFAVKNHLVGRGLAVSDRRVQVGVGDVRALSRLPPQQAYPAACRRYAANKSLGTGDVLLAVVVTDREETGMHAGLCTRGTWTWLQ